MTPCPLRGSGDTAACWHMMEYDRAVAPGRRRAIRRAEEPSRTGVTYCRIALRLQGSALDDLVPAHRRALVRI